VRTVVYPRCENSGIPRVYLRVYKGGINPGGVPQVYKGGINPGGVLQGVQGGIYQVVYLRVYKMVYIQDGVPQGV